MTSTVLLEIESHNISIGLQPDVSSGTERTARPAALSARAALVPCLFQVLNFLEIMRVPDIISIQSLLLEFTRICFCCLPPKTQPKGISIVSAVEIGAWTESSVAHFGPL